MACYLSRVDPLSEPPLSNADVIVNNTGLNEFQQKSRGYSNVFIHENASIVAIFVIQDMILTQIGTREQCVFYIMTPGYLPHSSRDGLHWRHNGRDGVSNHQPHHCLLNRLFRRKSKKAWKLPVTGLCAGNSPVTGEFPAQIASNAEDVFIRWRHYGLHKSITHSHSP